MTPDPATTGTDDLICEVTGTDIDGDTILYTYEWSDSNGVQQSMVEVPDIFDTVLASGLTVDTWSCEVTPYDGTDYGVSLDSSVLVESGCVIGEYDCPGLSCKDILDQGGSVGDGTYWIEFGAPGLIEVYCDMTTDGGGWTTVWGRPDSELLLTGSNFNGYSNWTISQTDISMNSRLSCSNYRIGGVNLNFPSGLNFTEVYSTIQWTGAGCGDMLHQSK